MLSQFHPPSPSSLWLVSLTNFCVVFAHRQNHIIGVFCFHCVQLVFWIRSYSAFMAIRLEYFKICKSIQCCNFRTIKIYLLRVSFLLEWWRTERPEQKQKLWFGHVFLAGCTGGVFKAICACPIELSKVRLQVKVSKLMISCDNFHFSDFT